jgi:phosphohistidine phosphatase
MKGKLPSLINKKNLVMLVTLLRHASAEDASLDTADIYRALTDKGEKQSKKLASFCLKNKLIPELLFSSPVLRAQQTARIFSAHLPGCPMPQAVDWLNLDSSASAIVHELVGLSKIKQDVWLVGHQPDLSQLAGLLLHTDGGNILIKKASLIRFEADFSGKPTATLLWSIPCSLLP